MRDLKLHAAAVVMALLILSSAEVFASDGGYSAAQIKDLIYRVMNFAAFFVILFVLCRKPATKFFRARREGIARNLEYLETQARNLAEQTEIMNKQIADVASEKESILAQYEKIGRKEADRIIAEAKAAAEVIIKKTQAAMEQETKTARQLLLMEIVKTATEAAEEMIKANISADDQKRLTGEFMTQVEKLRQ
jgi:F0F1-type ATP synthase membrane subunit b/b'